MLWIKIYQKLFGVPDSESNLDRRYRQCVTSSYLDDPRVAEEEDAEGDDADDGEGDPRPHEALKVRVRRRLAAVVHLRHVQSGVERVHGAARPEHVRVLRRRRHERQQAVDARAPVQAHVLLAQREGDGDEAVNREDDQDPDRRVAAREERELLQFARDRM